MATCRRTDAKANGKLGGGGPFCSNESDSGLLVTSFRAWADPTHIDGLQLGFSDRSTGSMIGVNAKKLVSNYATWVMGTLFSHFFSLESLLNHS